MTNAKMLELLNEYLENNNVVKLMDLKNGLTENIRVEIEKSKGTKVKDISVMKKVIKDVEEAVYSNEIFKGYHVFELNNKQYNGFCNGHFIFASTNDFGYEKSENPLDMKQMFSENGFEKNNMNMEIKVNLNDVKFFIKTHKKSDKKPYIINTDNFKIGINPYYLQNALEFCNSDTIYITKPNQPIYVKSEDYEKITLVLPMHIFQD